MDETYRQALAWSVAVLSIKMMVLHLLVIRARLATKLMNGARTPESEPENWQLPLFGIFHLTFGSAFGPLRSANDLERLNSMEENAAQNARHSAQALSSWSE